MTKRVNAEEPPERLLLIIASAIALAVGAIGGIFLIAIIGVINGGNKAKWLESGNIQDTIVAVTAVLGTITGIFGVVFVAKTLRATMLTLNSQIDMARDQAKANVLEYQARLSVETLGLRLNDDRNLVISIGIKNYGRSEARMAFAIAVDDVNTDDLELENMRGFLAYATIESDITQNQEIEIKPKDGRDAIPLEIALHISFLNYDNERIHADPLFIQVDIDEDDDVTYTRIIPTHFREKLLGRKL